MLFRKIPPLKRSLIGARRIEASVRQRAVRAFYERGLYKTRRNTGVLFFISLLEHKVWVLSDKGIYEKIDQETLNRFARAVSLGIKDGRACDALCQASKTSAKSSQSTSRLHPAIQTNCRISDDRVKALSFCRFPELSRFSRTDPSCYDTRL